VSRLFILAIEAQSAQGGSGMGNTQTPSPCPEIRIDLALVSPNVIISLN
jgi:hypothetical protein